MGSERGSPFYVVDLRDENMKAGSEAWRSACRVVRTALEEHGCFVARFDKVSHELCNSVVTSLKQLFSLPLELKKQKTNDKPLHGYIGSVPWLPLYESIGIDNPLSMDAVQNFAHFMWPHGNHTFCESINEYAKVMAELEVVARRMVFESYYDMKMERCESLIEETSEYVFRCLEYKPRSEGVDENVLGLEPHTDLSIISVLHPINNLNGLQVKTSHDSDDQEQWTAIEASPNSFVVMAGDALQVWSNGRIKSCLHRVEMKEKKARYATGIFSFCGNILEIPEEIMVDEQHPLRYKPAFHHYDYLRFFDQHRIRQPQTRINAYCGI
ncbi:hypothetical protein HN51_015144 [Arachis hypogaea]|uniref:Fe2OG dioxygenase domain-containing protein n=1 Tax=Arachis hypogaea TaxID=3818 RepID=A0A445CLT1_ARAHY|nr:2-oxoglutarate-dependent dioxygenase AOP3 [Arachis hypogaea]QHO44841.1 putative 2-oxoglutarate-dependent dioxygenase AOP1 [Arachis hypogaea]RYR51890.1 hypothetical protein Ahy_A06g026847 [Arachis hypogaea]